jgi:hypothetical protein
VVTLVHRQVELYYSEKLRIVKVWLDFENIFAKNLAVLTQNAAT